MGFVLLDVNALMILLLWVLRTIILYTVVGTFVALLLSPLVRLVERTGLPRGMAVAFVFVGAVVAFIGIVVLFTAPLVSAVEHFAKQLPTLVRQAEHGHGRSAGCSSGSTSSSGSTPTPPSSPTTSPRA